MCCLRKWTGPLLLRSSIPKLSKKMMTRKNPMRQSSCKSGHRKSLLNRSSCRLRCQKRPMLLAAKLHFWLNIPVKSSGRIKSYFIMPQRIHLLPQKTLIRRRGSSLKKPVPMLRTWRLVLSIGKKVPPRTMFFARPFCLYRFSWNKRQR